MYFSWAIHEKGYLWLTAENTYFGLTTGVKENGPFLIDNPKGRKVHIYTPLEDEPELFSEFATLDGTPNDLLKFANKYGMLTKGHLYAPVIKDNRKQPINAESYQLWRSELRDFALTYLMWRCLEENRFDDLGQYIRWDKDSNGVHVIYILFDEHMLLAGENQNQAAFNTFVHGDVIAPAKFFMQTILTRKLKEGISLIPIQDSSWKLHRYDMPVDLIHALWLQLFLAVTDEKKFVPCEWCGLMLEVTDKTRSTKKYHDKCRKALWRAKNQIKLLSSEGKTVEDIVAETNLPKHKVVEWINEVKKN